MTDGREHLRARDIARLMGVSTRTVRRWIANEIIPSIKVGGVRVVPKAELTRLLSPLSTTIEDATDDE